MYVRFSNTDGEPKVFTTGDQPGKYIGVLAGIGQLEEGAVSDPYKYK
jgi:hypothetical protein